MDAAARHAGAQVQIHPVVLDRMNLLDEARQLVGERRQRRIRQRGLLLQGTERFVGIAD